MTATTGQIRSVRAFRTVRWTSSLTWMNPSFSTTSVTAVCLSDRCVPRIKRGFSNSVSEGSAPQAHF